MEVDYLLFRPFFNCEVEDDQVIVKDTFSTTFTIDDLTFHPVKFCSDSLPVIIRDIEKGITGDLRGDITRSLAKGNIIQVPEKRVYTVGYITEFQEGMAERCEISQAYNTQKKKCEQYIEEKPDIIEVSREIKFIEVGLEEFAFKNQGKIGELEITSGKPEFICSSEDARKAPNPSEDCWLIPVNEAKIKYGEKTQLNPYLSVTSYTEAEYRGIVQEGHTNTLKVSFLNKEFLETELVKEIEYFIIKGKQFNLPVIIDNKLSNFQQAGVRLEVNNVLLNKKSTTFVEFPIKKGKETYNINLEANQFGKFEYNIVPYIKVGDRFIFDDQQITYNLEVVDEVPKDVKIVEKKSLLQKIINFLKDLFKRIP